MANGVCQACGYPIVGRGVCAACAPELALIDRQCDALTGLISRITAGVIRPVISVPASERAG